MPCPYHEEPADEQSIGCCNDNRAKVPSETHERCMCRSNSGVYADSCPIYAKFLQGESHLRKRDLLKCAFLAVARKTAYNDQS